MTANLIRVRWAVRLTLALGVAASVAANILHARHNPISQAIAAWPPLALLVTVELISRVPVGNRWLAFVRVIATAAISGIAAWVSYWHMVGVVARYGETGASPYLMPFSVDGLIVVASICLVEIGARIRTVPSARPVATTPVQLVDQADEHTTIPAQSAGPVPVELLPGARIIANSHRQATGTPITPDLLAERMNISATTAAGLLTALDPSTPTRPATRAINGTPMQESLL